MAQQNTPAVLAKAQSKLNKVHKAPAFLFAALVSGLTWYYQNRQINYFAQAQEQAINRVQFDQTSDKFLNDFKYTDAKKWEGVKVNLDGIILPGRYVIKRKRGDQDGYIILAPFTVQADIKDFRTIETMSNRGVHRKFMINLGWLPKSSKHLIVQSCAYDIVGTQEYTEENRTEALRKQQLDGLFRDPLQAEKITPITNVTAYVRLGESEDRAHGYYNDKNLELFKYIDLKSLCRVFRIRNQLEGELVYLERTGKSDEEYQTTPIPASKELVVSELKDKTKEYSQNCTTNAIAATLGSFTLATLLTVL